MHGSKHMHWVALGLALALAGCAYTPAQLEYRQRLELGVTAPQDVERFALADGVVMADMASQSERPSAQTVVPHDAWFQAIQAGNLDAAKKLLAQGAHVNARDAAGRSALTLAAQQGQVELVRALLKAGAKVNGVGEGWPPLSAATVRGHTPVVQLLLRSGAALDVPAANGHVPLVDAVRLNRVDVATALLQAGASRRSVDRAGDNVLLIAVDENNAAMLQTLLRHGVPADLMDSNGLTPLYWAEYRQREPLAALLRAAGADPARKKTELVSGQRDQKGEW